MDEKTILSSAFKLITEAFGWVDEENDIAYRDFYNYASGINDIVHELTRKLDKLDKTED